MVLLHMYAMRGIMWYCVSYSYNVLLSNTVLITPIFFLIWASLIHNVVLRRWKGVFCPFPCYNWSRDLVFFTGHGWYHLFSTTYRAHRLWNSDSKSKVCGKTLQFYLTEWQKVPFYLRMSLLNTFCLKVPCLNCPVLAYAHSQRIAKWELCTLHVFLSINYRQFHNFIVSSVLIECWVSLCWSRALLPVTPPSDWESQSVIVSYVNQYYLAYMCYVTTVSNWPWGGRLCPTNNVLPQIGEWEMFLYDNQRSLLLNWNLIGMI